MPLVFFLVLRGGGRSVKEAVDHKKYEYEGQDQDGFLKRPRGHDQGVDPEDGE